MATVARPRLTEQQRRAVDTRDVSVALSAGAGCGKTHVLVERYLSHLAPGMASPQDAAAALGGLIAITFTDRAAREMRDRVRRTCRERSLAATDPREADAWRALLRALEGARISTIHAFCASLLRSHAVEAGVDPRFDVLQAGQAETMFSELLDDQLREQLGAQSEDLLALAVAFGLPRLREMIGSVLARRQDIDFDAWAQVTPEALVVRWQRAERERVLPALRKELLAMPEVHAIRKIVQYSKPEHATLRQRFAALAPQFVALDAGEELLPALEVIRANAMVKGVAEKHWHSAEIYAEFRDAATALRKWIEKAVTRIGVNAETALASAAAGLSLLRVAAPVIAAYEARKQELGLLDFDDLLRRTRDLLRGEHGKTLLKQMSSRLVLLLVDEFQDTDRLQVELVRLLCGDELAAGKLFFVGDAKQSIYRFRGAEPEVFRKLREGMPARARLPLTRNFRSQPAILDFVNALFCDRLLPEYEPLEADRPALSSGPHVEFLWATPPAETEETQNAAALRRREADWIARRLALLFASGEVLLRDKAAGGTRAAQPGDAAILFRSLSDVQYYEAALREHGIPYYLVGGSAFYAQQEVFDLLNLLRTLDSPHDEVSLAGALRSPFFALADETLFWLSQHRRGLSAGLFDGATIASIADPAQQVRARAAAATLAALRAQKDRLPIAALIRTALARTGYDAVLLAEFLGERKLANLRKLIDQARAFDESAIFTLADYIHQLAEFVARQPDEPAAPIEPESSTVVRLMTIHQAKGLEFPVVVVPDLTRRPGGDRSAVAFDEELGPLVRSTERGEADSPCGLSIYRYLNRDEEADEEARLFYVATTRAADHLILSAGLKDLDRPSGAWVELLGERFDLRTGELKATLPPGYARPVVGVQLTEPPVPAAGEASGKRADPAAAAAAARATADEQRGVVPPLVAPLAVDEAARRVFSFSRLSGALDRSDPVAAADARVEDERAQIATSVDVVQDADDGDATALGTFVHAVLAQVNFSRPDDAAQRCHRELERRYAAPAFDPAAAQELIERFTRSPRAAALAAAAQLHRELEFLVAWPPAPAVGASTTARSSSAAARMFSGFIDCLYQDAAGRWHLVDFKTNRVTAATVPATATKYELQMGLYAIAAEQVCGVSPESLVLHFLRPGIEHAVPWTQQARERVIERINRALAANG